METSHNFTPRAQQAIEVARQAAKENNTRIIELMSPFLWDSAFKSRPYHGGTSAI